MYIVRWLTGHPMIAVWVLGAIAILLSYGSSGNKEQNEGEKTAVAEVTTLAATDADSIETTKIETTSTQNQDSGTDTKNNTEASSELTAEKPMLPSNDNPSKNKIVAEEITAPSLNTTSTIADVVKQNIVTAESDSDNAKQEEKVATEENKDASNDSTSNKQPKESNVEVDNKSSLNNNDTEVADLGQLDSDEMLKMAREAYWNNGLDEAAQIYQQLIKMEPKVVEHRGELGNVYWRQGYPKKAAEIYSEIAIPMIENGNSNRVANMIGFIGLFYPDRASVIHDRLQNHQDNSK